MSKDLVSIRPGVAFGMPCMRGTGTRSSVVLDMFTAGDGVDPLAENFRVAAVQVEDAIRFEFDELRAELTRIRRHVVEHLPCRMDAPGHPQCACGAPSQLEAGLCVACAEAIR